MRGEGNMHALVSMAYGSVTCKEGMLKKGCILIFEMCGWAYSTSDLGIQFRLIGRKEYGIIG
jgi:hypothetical protein